MLRRVLAPEPYAAAATWSRRAANFGALLALFAVGLGRSGGVDSRSAVAVLAVGLLAAVLALVFAAAAAAAIWRTGRRGTRRTLAGVAVALLVLAYPAYLAVQALRLPMLDDVSTDLAVPPAFSASPQALLARGNTVHAEPSPESRAAQQRAYPGVQPVLLDVDGTEALRLVLKIVAARGWRLVETLPPKGRFGVGHIDAVARSRIMAFPEDVTIRLRPSEGQTRIDIRSASRFEPHDFGSNAARIEAFAEDLQNAE
jgi:uncharacterized protein (DUF1499 family)